MPSLARVVKWQTRAFEGRMPQGMGVRVPPRAFFPHPIPDASRGMIRCNRRHTDKPKERFSNLAPVFSGKQQACELAFPLLERLGEEVERVAGIEPAWPAWKAGTLPLSYTRVTGWNLWWPGVSVNSKFLAAPARNFPSLIISKSRASHCHWGDSRLSKLSRQLRMGGRVV